MAATVTPRPYCYRCRRAQRMCLCAAIRECHNQTAIHVLQHRLERRHAFGTVPILELGLTNLFTYVLALEREGVMHAPPGFPTDAGILYPGDSCQALEGLPANQRPRSLVAIDGTWSQAYRIFRDAPWLHRLPQFSLRPDAPSRYRIRKEPSDECLSTLESVVLALSVLEPDNTSVQSLASAFDLMVERQLECVEKNRDAPKRQRKARRPRRAIPDSLWNDPERIVVVYGEPAHDPTRGNRKARSLAQWAAVRATDTSQVFNALMKPCLGEQNGFFLKQMGWDASDLEDVESLADVQKRWREFVRPGDQFVAWHPSTLRWGQEHDLVHSATLLKCLYDYTSPGKTGALEDVAEQHMFATLSLPVVKGRAQVRLARATRAWELLARRGRMLASSMPELPTAAR